MTALQLGIAKITAKLGDLKSAPLALQVLPLRVDLMPAGANVPVGGTLQYKAVARDVNGAEISNVTWRWVLTGGSGAPARTASIDSNGLLREDIYDRPIGRQCCG